jgi:hypothetical protein
MRPFGNVIFVGPLINGPDKKLGLIHRDYRIVGEMRWGNPVTNHKLNPCIWTNLQKPCRSYIHIRYSDEVHCSEATVSEADARM